MLVSSIFSFFHNVFKWFLFESHSELGLSDKEFTRTLVKFYPCLDWKHSDETNQMKPKSWCVCLTPYSIDTHFDASTTNSF